MIDFVTPEEFVKVVAQQPYFHQMTTADLYARGHTAPQTYLSWYQKNILPWSLRDRLHMTAVAAVAASRWPLAITRLPWRFAKVDEAVENGYPHTFQDIIVWNSAIMRLPFGAQVRLAVHEAVHVWQRANPERTSQLHRDRGFYTIDTRSRHLRNNPDADGHIWARAGQMHHAEYSSDRPQSLVDVRETPDHPNELMAYAISSLI